MKFEDVVRDWIDDERSNLDDLMMTSTSDEDSVYVEGRITELNQLEKLLNRYLTGKK